MNTDPQTPSPLMAALHSHIQAVAARPIDVRMLVELEKTCLLARELLVIGKEPNATQKRSLVGNIGNMGIGMDMYEVQPSGPSQFIGQPAYSSPQETFGVTAIRELVGSIAAFLPKHKEAETGYSDLVSAITAAKAAGETDLELQLREELRQKLPAAHTAEVVTLHDIALPGAEAVAS